MNTSLKSTVAMGLGALALIAMPVAGFGQESIDADDAIATEVRDENRTVQLYVVNNNFLDVNVYAVRGLSRFRLGSVTSHTGEFLTVPTWVTHGGLNVQLQARPIGGGRSVTADVQINPGDVVEWRIENSLNLSSLSVWST